MPRPPRSPLSDPLFPYPTLFRSPAPRHPLRIRARARARMVSLPYFSIVGTRSLRRSYSFPDRGFTNGNRRGNHAPWHIRNWTRSEEHTSELQSLMRISYAVFCLQKKKKNTRTKDRQTIKIK